MFKSVTYEGFESAPELRQRCEAIASRLEARRILPSKRITLRWALHGEPAGVSTGREVEFQLTDDRIGTERLCVPTAELDDGEEVVDAIIRRRMLMLDRFMDGIIDGFEINRVPEGV